MADFDRAALDSFAFQIVGRFAVAQRSIDEAVWAHLTSRLDGRISALVRKRLRLSDAERLEYALALAHTVGLRFPAKALTETELGHGATEAIGTHFGDASRCLECRIVRLLEIA